VEESSSAILGCSFLVHQMIADALDLSWALFDLF